MKKLLMLGIVFVLMISSAAAYVAIDSLKADQFSPTSVRISSTLNIKNAPADERIKIIAMIPELGLRTSAGPFAPANTINKMLLFTLPDYIDEVRPGDEIVIRYHVKTESGKKRTKHRILIAE